MSSTVFPAAEKLPILVVDDDSALIRTLSDILRLHGYAPTSAATGGEGLRIARDTSPALAVVDLGLPDMGGLEVVSRLHEVSQFTEVVVLTGNASVESAVGALREHSIDYLLKPVQVEQLLRVASVASERWQRRHAEERLKESDERFRAVVESELLGIMFWDADGRIFDANDAFLKLSGYSRDDLEQGKIDWLRMTPPEWKTLDDSKLAEIQERGVITPYEKEYLRKDGNRVPVLLGATTLSEKRDTGVAFVLDVTDRKKAERELQARAREQEAVALFGQRALVTQSVHDLFDEALALLGRTLDAPYGAVLELRSVGKPVVAMSVRGWGATVVGRSFGEAVAGGEGGFAAANVTPGRTARVAVESVFPGDELQRSSRIKSGITVVIPGPAHPYGALAVHDTRQRDFTRDDVFFLQAIAHIVGTAVERERSESAMRQSQRMEAVGRLAGSVAHDFNNMLTAINGYGEIVRSALKEGDALRDDVDEILKASQRAAGLTKQLLAFSRQQVLQPRAVNLNDVVKQMEGMLRRLLTADIEFVTTLEPKLGTTRTDPGQMEQVIMNLVVNARDAMPDGGRLVIETSNVEFIGRTGGEVPLAPGRYVTLAVTDTGSGMDAETRARVFEPFFTTKGPESGTGLGLATVYGVVKQSGGEIWVYSEPGQGASFKVFLPLIDAP